MVPPFAAERVSVPRFISDCTSSAALCEKEFETERLAAELATASCMPDDVAAVRHDVVEWLAKHPGEHEKDLLTAVSDARAALWPCNRS